SNDFGGGTFSVELISTNLRLKFTGAPATLGITTASLPNGTIGAAYAATVAASGGTTPYTWSILSGALPDSLTIDTNSGAISGTPTATGTFNFTVQAADASAATQTATKALSITIAPALASIAVTPANPVALTGSNVQFTATGTYSDSSTQNLTAQA